MKIKELPEPQELTQAQMAYRRLEEMIVTLELEPGCRISEASMSKRLRLGRTPVREAMQRLAREGSLIIMPRAGAIVSTIDLTEQFKLIEIRREIERVVMGRAARQANSSARAAFKDLRKRFLQAARKKDEKIFIPADRAFNLLVVETADNRYATAALALIQAQTRRFWFLYFKRFGEVAEISNAHAAIAEAIAKNDESRAREASDALIDCVEAYTMKTLKVLL